MAEREAEEDKRMKVTERRGGKKVGEGMKSVVRKGKNFGKRKSPLLSWSPRHVGEGRFFFCLVSSARCLLILIHKSLISSGFVNESSIYKLISKYRN